MLVWAHFSLSAVRHIPIYVLAAVPVLATELTQIVSAAWANSKKSSLPGIFRDIDRDLRPKFGANSIWALVFPLLIWWSSAAKWPTDFPADRFPVTALESAGKALEGKRVFMSDQWGDYFIYRQWPASLAYLDGRSDFYGREIGGEALAIASGAGDWERKLESRGIAFALLPTGSPLSQAMLRSRWEVLHKDGLAIVLRRPGRGAPAQ